MLSKGRSFCRNVLFADEKWFVLDSSPNTQNDRYWASSPPNLISQSRYQGKKKVMCWMGVLNGSILGPYWFIDERGRNLPVNGENYLEMLQNELWPNLETRTDLRRTWFMQDGAPPHVAHDVLDWIKSKFGNQIISRSTSLIWPPEPRFEPP